jgi:nitrite reductase/ring-hydroxylating ferredoxin subunit
LASDRAQRPDDGDDAADGTAPAVDPQRRRLLQVAGAAVGAGVLLAGGAALRFLVPAARAAPPLRAGRPDEFPPHGLRLLTQAPIFVLHEEEGFAALSARCPHLGCLVQRRGAGYVCPCHGSEFDARGGRLSGAARRGLHWLEVQVTADAVYVNPSVEVAAGTFVHG